MAIKNSLKLKTDSEVTYQLSKIRKKKTELNAHNNDR